MIFIKIENGQLDTSPDVRLSFELNNLIFSNSDSTVLPGSYSFPFTLPATDHNRTLLNFPDRFDNAVPLVADQSVQVGFKDKILFIGTLRVTNANKRQITVDIVANPLSQLKEVKLTELDLGNSPSFEGAAGMLEHAKDTTTAPLDFPYVFFPLGNSKFLNADFNGNLKSYFQNYWNMSTHSFDISINNPILTPFVRVEYLLEKMFSKLSYAFKNEWQLTPELRQLCQYNNNSLWNEGIARSFAIKDHVPKETTTSWLRATMGTFCLGLFTNPWSKVITLKPLRDVLQAQTKHDWTGKLLYTPTVLGSESDAPETLCFEEDGSDSLFDKYGRQVVGLTDDLITDSLDWEDFEGIVTTPGIYYIKNRREYWIRTSAAFFLDRDLECAPVRGQDVNRKFEASNTPIFWTYYFDEFGNLPDAVYEALSICEITGTVKYTIPSEDPIEQTNDIPMRLLWYRGIQNVPPYPTGCPLAIDSTGSWMGDYELVWKGERGLFQQWWLQWLNMLKNGSQVSMSLDLTITDLLNFNMDEKVRIQNMDFLIKKMSVSISNAGLEPVVVEVVSVI